MREGRSRSGSCSRPPRSRTRPWRRRPRARRSRPGGASYDPLLMSWLADAERVDVAVYAAIAQAPTPTLDHAMSMLSQAANYSRLSISAAALLAGTGGRAGKRAAADGLISVAVTSAVVNLVVKPLGRRHRPDRAAQEVPIARYVAMPRSSSFPSGHSASAFAFATGVG